MRNPNRYPRQSAVRGGLFHDRALAPFVGAGAHLVAYFQTDGSLQRVTSPVAQRGGVDGTGRRSQVGGRDIPQSASAPRIPRSTRHWTAVRTRASMQPLAQVKSRAAVSAVAFVQDLDSALIARPRAMGNGLISNASQSGATQRNKATWSRHAMKFLERLARLAEVLEKSVGERPR